MSKEIEQLYSICRLGIPKNDNEVAMCFFVNEFEESLEALDTIVDELFKDAPKECAQDIHDAWLALGRAWDKFQAAKENSI